MKAHSRDPKRFATAKQQRQEALDALERLEWAEKAEQERQEQSALDEKRAKLAEAQERALAAHIRAREITAELGPILAEVVDRVRELHACRTEVDRGVHYESFGLRDGYLERPLVPAALDVPGELAVMVIRIGRALVKVANIDVRVADTKAAQGVL